MAEYIEKKRVVDALTRIAVQVPDRKMRTVAKCISAVELLPSSPHIPPFRHGQWRRTGRILDGLIEIQCSECEETHLFDMIRLETAARYCPYCGVKWDGGADNGE